MSVRKSARTAVTQRLEAANIPGAHIAQSIYRPTDDEKLPCIYVFLGDESIDDSQAPELLSRTSDVEIVIMTSGQTAQDTLDDLIAAVETAIGGEDRPDWLPPSSNSFRLSGIRVAPDRDGATVTLSAVMTYRLEYFTTQGQP